MSDSPIGLTDSDIYERVLAAILDHSLSPGTKLVEDKLAAAFGVSRTRIRPALVRLANEQVVTLTPNRGATVAEPSEQESREVFEVRRLIESTLVARFIEIASDAQIESLAEPIETEMEARDRGDMRCAIRASGDFHLRIAEHANHATLRRILRELVARTSLVLMAYSDDHRSRVADATACGCQEHRALLDAIRARDSQLATRLMSTHLNHLESRLRFQGTSRAPDLMSLFGSAA